MRGKILLADDDPELLVSLSAVLSSEGYEVITASNGREACEHFREHYVDIAVLDLKMPVRDGWDAFERLTTIHPLLQIIIVTARGGIGAMNQAKPIGVPALNSLYES